MNPRTRRLALAALCCTTLGLGLFSLLHGELNQDEGWYLYGARLVWEGQWPFRDFAATQPPVFFVAYAPLTPWIRVGGLAVGRLATLLLGLGAWWGAARLARRLAPDKATADWAPVLVWTLGGLNLYHAYFTTVVKTYALGSLLLTWGLAALLSPAPRRRSFWWAGILLALAPGVRLSLGLALPIAALYVWWRHGGARLLDFALPAAATLLLWSLPFWLAAPDNFIFGLTGYHTARDVGPPAYQLALKAGFLVRLIQAYAALSIVLAGLCLLPRANCPAAPRDPRQITLWLVFGAISFLHLAAPFPYDDYQVVVMPLLVVLATLPLATRFAAWPAALATRAWLTLALAALLLTAASPLPQTWLLAGRDRIWWRLKTEPDLPRLRRAAAWIRARTTPDELLLTQDTYLAVEADRRVPPGLELGPFSLYPDLTRAQAQARRVVNLERLREIITAAEAPVAAFSGYGLSIAAPAITPLDPAATATLQAALEAHYQPLTTWPRFGQGHTTLTGYGRREPPP